MVAWRIGLLALALAAASGCATEPAPSLLLPTAADEGRPGRDGRLPTGTPPAIPRPTVAGELDRQMADSEELREQREALVEGAIASAVEDERIVDAFRTVPRHAFVPTDVLERAYADFALPIEAGQTISQPSLVAMMTELVQIEPGERVLEVGTGSGFQAAILRQLTDEVYSVEIIPELSGIASTVLERLGYGDIRLERRDGYLGWPEAAPFDAIVVTAAPDHLPRPLVDQLSPDGGRMVIPIGPVGDVQTLWLVTRNGEDVAMEEVVPVRFVPLTREEP
ncbi:MAG TPA: protein-L-isoaspartate(D-aspartate) O-methyltransferase [Candidatus Limnocylindria bacterium]|nr:protein-L-isoaspartate(D-aspartate) O-methyltransferase [Candidatus Limnocylindria bacterium]